MLLINLIKKAFATPIPELNEKIKRAMKVYFYKFPSLIVLQTASACNLKCSHCFINNYGKEIPDGKIKIMDFDEFIQFVEQLKPAIKHADYFQFTTFEPFLQKHLFKMMDYILEINPKIKFPILTNAQLLNRELLEKLKKYPISEFTVSLDGFKKETVETFKTDSDFDKTIEIMKIFNEQNFSVPLQCVFVMQKNNYKELPEYIDFVNSIGVKRIFVNNLLSFTKTHSDLTLYNKNIEGEIEEIFSSSIKKVEVNSQELILPSIYPKLQGCKSCEMLFVDINGNIAPCDFLAVQTPFYFNDVSYTAKPVIFGNIFKESALKIFRSKQYNEFRNRHREGKELPDECLSCINAYGLMCSNRNKYGKIN